MAEKQLGLEDYAEAKAKAKAAAYDSKIFRGIDNFNRTNNIVLRPNNYDHEWHIEACTFYFGEADRIQRAIEAKKTRTQDIEKHTNFVVLRPNTYNYGWHIEACTFYFVGAASIRRAVEAKGGEHAFDEVRIVQVKDLPGAELYDRYTVCGEGTKIIQMGDYA